MVVVISGATKGVGRALTLALAREGYDLAISSRNQQDLDQLKVEIQKNYAVEILLFAGDLSDADQALTFSNKIIDTYKHVDILINNIGKYENDAITDENADLESMMKTNLFAAYFLSKTISVNMCKGGKGHIFNVCSVLSFSTRPAAATYTISKHALKGFNDVLREEMREYGIKVTAIYPGSINTSSWEGIYAPKDLFVQPDDIVKVVKTCLSISKNANIEEIVIKPLDKNY